MDPNKTKALDQAIGQIDKQFGQGSIVRLGSENSNLKVEAISTGSINLDLALGVQGVPKGRITEIFGAESSGKSTLSYHVIASCQKSSGVAAYIDTEHALDPGYAKRCGVNLNDLLVSQPNGGEEALEICEYLVRSGAVDLVVVDSVAALVPKAELEGDMGDSHVGLQARLMSQALRKLTPVISSSNCAVIFINQLREKIGVMFGNPETTPGGRALKFYSSLRIDLRRIETIKIGTEAVGNKVRARIVKNKVAPPFKTAEFEIVYNHGISREADIIQLGVENEIITKSGSFYSYGETKLGQGKEAVKQFLKDNDKMSKEIESKVISIINHEDNQN
ncbi:MAG: recombinase RecA [Chloroflexi bacterium]|nr:recombinase RecA [Chloroflexota bacterium]|tara:strand:- start:268 stop:1272 length:1005 start_codon:yes stop_codon:yes gene_type:complete